MTAGYGEGPVPDERVTALDPRDAAVPAPRNGWAPVGYPGHPTSYPTSGPAGYPPPSAPPGRRRSPGLLIAVGVLAALVVVQGAFLISVNQKLTDADHKISTMGRDGTDLNNRVSALEHGTMNVAAVAGAVLPSVFRIDVPDGTATAFAIGSAGSGTDMVTNFHVVATLWKSGQRDASIEHDNQRFPVHVVRVDENNDLALLHADARFPALTVNPKQLPPGTPVAVIGAPLGLAQSVTSGVVSAVRNDVPGDAGRTYIQFDAAINPGNSGGPVVNPDKQVVGIASEKAGNSEGIGLAIPISVACQSFSGIC